MHVSFYQYDTLLVNCVYIVRIRQCHSKSYFFTFQVEYILQYWRGGKKNITRLIHSDIVYELNGLYKDPLNYTK